MAIHDKDGNSGIDFKEFEEMLLATCNLKFEEEQITASELRMKLKMEILSMS